MPQTLRKGAILLVRGLDSSRPGEYIEDQSTPRVENFTVRRNILQKRSGSVAFGSQIAGTDKYIFTGREFERENTRFHVRIGQDKIEQYTGGSWSDISGVDLTGTSTDTIDTATPLLTGKKILCITNGIDNIRKWTGTGNTADLGGTPPKAKFIQEYKTYLVAAHILGGVDITERVQWCDTADPENWSTGNAGAQDLVEGDRITGLNTFADTLCVHKSNSIWLGRLVNNTDIFNFTRIATEAGTVSNGTIVNLPTNEQIFLAADGLRLFNGISAPRLVDEANDEIRDSLNKEFVYTAWGLLISELSEVWIALPIGSQTSPDTIYRYNYRDKKVFKDIRSGISAAWNFTNAEAVSWDGAVGTWDAQTRRWNDGILLVDFPRVMLGSNDGYSYEVDENSFDDNGTAIEAFWESKDFQPELGRNVRWLELHVYAKGNSIEAEYSTDGGLTWIDFLQSPATLNGEFPSDTNPLIFYFDAVGSRCRVRFSNRNVDESLSIKQFYLGYLPRELVN